MPMDRVRAVVVDHNGGALTTRCLDSLLATTWPGQLEIVVVDNASDPRLSDEITSRTGVRVVRSDRNRGFAGGANLGMGDVSTTDAVALVNNDATVERAWLGPLVEALETGRTVGAASPKIRFTGRYLTFEIASEPSQCQRLDRRLLGVRLHDVSAPSGAFQLVDGFWGPEVDGHGRSFEWTNGRGRIHVRVDDPSVEEIGLLLSACAPTVVVLAGAAGDVDILVDREPRWFSVALAG